MEVKQILKTIMKKAWLIILLPLVTSLVAAYVSYRVLDPVYVSNTTLYVINKSNVSQLSVAYSDLMAGDFLVKDYREIIKSRTVTQAIIDELGLQGISAARLGAQIGVNLKNDTRVLELTVADYDPYRAKKIADSLATIFIEKITQMMKVENVSIIDKANLPTAPVSPNPRSNILIAFFAGVIAAAGIVFLLDYLDDTIKTEEDVENYLGLSVLGTIPELALR